MTNYEIIKRANNVLQMSEILYDIFFSEFDADNIAEFAKNKELMVALLAFYLTLDENVTEEEVNEKLKIAVKGEE